MRTIVADLDGSLIQQTALLRWADAHDAEVSRTAEHGPRLRGSATRGAVRSWAREVLGSGRTPEPTVVLYGSGDFHHVTFAFLERLTAPTSVIHVDNHPDWARIPRWLNCGGWVSSALRLPGVARIVTLGCCSDDLSWPELKSANLPAIRDGRLEVYPWRHGPSRVLADYGRTACAWQRATRLHWCELEHRPWLDFVRRLVCELPTPDVYVTIDKDALRYEDAVTNWDQGMMTLEHVRALIGCVADHRRIVGVDICGDYSRPRHADPIRALVTALDHPREARPAGADEAAAVNGSANVALLESLRAALC